MKKQRIIYGIAIFFFLNIFLLSNIFSIDRTSLITKCDNCKTCAHSTKKLNLQYKSDFFLSIYPFNKVNDPNCNHCEVKGLPKKDKIFCVCFNSVPLFKTVKYISIIYAINKNRDFITETLCINDNLRLIQSIRLQC